MPQALLTVADKYDMPALLARAGAFLQANLQQANDSTSRWRWIAAADKAGLSDVA
jgi:hypothetical protein